jgi:hypothetical protein
VAWLLVEEFGFGLPLLPDELSGGEVFEDLQPAGVVVGVEKQPKVRL